MNNQVGGVGPGGLGGPGGGGGGGSVGPGSGGGGGVGGGGQGGGGGGGGMGGGGGIGSATEGRDRRRKESILDLSKYLDKAIRVKFSGGREAAGVLKGYDPLLNLVLDDTTEYLRDSEDPYKLTEETRMLGLVVCRGTSVVLICPVDGMEAIPNPFIAQDTVKNGTSRGQTMIRVETRRDISAWQLVCNLLTSSTLHYVQHGDKGGGFQGAQATYIFLMAVTIWLTKFKLYLSFLPIWDKLRAIFDPLSVSLVANFFVQYFWVQLMRSMAMTVCKLSEYLQDRNMGYMTHNFLVSTTCKGGYINVYDLLACLTLVWVASSLQLVGSFRIPSSLKIWGSRDDDDDDDCCG